MRICQLECFRALMIHGPMTRAAELLDISQPAVSTTIAALEHEVGPTLFVRRGGRLQPTPEAHLFFAEAARALEAVENTTRIAGEIRAGRRGHLAIAAYPSISISLLPRILAQFQKKRPELQMKIITRNSMMVRELMSTQQFDFVIAELPIDYPTSHGSILLCVRVHDAGGSPSRGPSRGHPGGSRRRAVCHALSRGSDLSAACRRFLRIWRAMERGCGNRGLFDSL